MEQRNSFVVILLAALLGSAAILPKSSGSFYVTPPTASSQSKSEGANAPATPLRASTAKGIVKEFLSGSFEDDSFSFDVYAALLDATTLKAIVDEFFAGSLEDDGYEFYVALLDATSLGRLELLPGWKIDSLIATVPDPVESGLGSVFDDYVDSIEHAVSAEDYVPDHFYNPWPLPSELAKEASGDQSDGQADSGDDDSQAKQQHVPIYEREPGLILFRDNANQRLLVVFLVGETPTSGIHKAAFESALDQASELQMPDSATTCSDDNDCPSEIKVMGPSFSGSAPSITLAIEEWSSGRLELTGNAPKVEIISGAATAVDEKQFQSMGDTYQTTIIPNSAEMDALLSWLGRQNVAILSEEGTAFGAYSRNSTIIKPRGKILYLQFPLHIAELQRASERAVQTAKTGVATTPSPSNPNLPLDTHASRTRRDLLPLYSTAETNRAELVLDANLQEINEHRIDYVILAATDPADISFLVHWIRQNCPTVTPIVLNADLLYLHTDVDADTRGMMVASTYPLYLENQLWTRDGGPIQFSMNTSEGIYNATVALLADPIELRAGKAPMLDYVKPFHSGSVKPPCDSQFEAHPLWISIVGVDHLWPISIQDACVQANYMVSIPTSSASAASDDQLKLYPKAFTRICGLIALGCLLVCSLILGDDASIAVEGFSPIEWLRSKTPNAVKQILGPAVLSEYKDLRQWVALLFSAVLLCLLAALAYYFFLPFRMGMAGELADKWKFWAALFVTSATVVLWLVSIAPLSWFAKVDQPQSGINLARRIFLLLAIPAFVTAIVCMSVWLIPPGDPAARYFLFLRTADLGSKVSPLVPMLLSYAAAVALILGALRRLALLESRQVLTPFLDFGTASFSGVADLEQATRNIFTGSADRPIIPPHILNNKYSSLADWVRASFRTSDWSWRSCAIAGTIAIAYWRVFPDQQWLRRDIDTFGFEIWFFLVSFLVYIGIALAIVKMVRVWLSVRTLLRRIYTHPSRGGYAAYRQQLHFIKEPAVDLLSKVPAMSQLEVALDQVRQLIVTSDDTSTRASTEVGTRLDTMRPWLGLLLPWVERSINETEQAQASAQWSQSILAKRQTEIWMTYMSWTIAYVFEPLWRTVNANRRPRPLAGIDSKDSKPIDTIGEIYVASRVVDFLRQVMPQLESLALTTTVAMLLMLFAVSSYPFPARDDLLWFSWFVVVATVGSMMWMFFSLNRDRVASMIAGTTPGQTDWNSTLGLQVAMHALIPILVLLGAAFPARLGTFVTWIGSLFGGHA